MGREDLPIDQQIKLSICDLMDCKECPNNDKGCVVDEIIMDELKKK